MIKRTWNQRRSTVLFVSSTVFSLLANAAESTTDKADALFDAVNSGNVQVVQELIDAGANVNAKGDHGYTPLHRAIFRKNPEMVKLLFQQQDIDVNAQANDGFTPLHMAIFWKNPEMVKLLLQQQDIDVNATDVHWVTPLRMALFNNLPKITRLLIQYGADTSNDSLGALRPKQEAVLKEQIRSVREETVQAIMEAQKQLPTDIAHLIAESTY